MKYFTIAELCRTSRPGIDNTPPSGVVIALTALIEKVLDPAREAYGSPIRATSGYRSPALNKAVGGVPTSQHLRGEAVDLDLGSRAANKRLYEILLAQGNFDQLINERDFSWVHVSYKRPPASNRRSAFKLPALALLLTLLFASCAKVNYVPYTRVERVIDTVTRTAPDSASMRALFACDSAGQVYLRELTEYKGREAQQDVVFKDGALKVETRWRTQYIDRLREVHDTTTIVQEIEIVREIKQIPKFFWWTFGIALLAVAYLLWRVFR